MKLKDITKQYREQHGMSKREFGRKCGFSNAYVSVLESGVNPHTGETLKPTVHTYTKIAKAMGISLNDLLNMLDDNEHVMINSYIDNGEECIARKKLLNLIEQLPDEQLPTYCAVFELPIERLQAVVELLK